MQQIVIVLFTANSYSVVQKVVFLIMIACKFPKQIQNGSFDSSILWGNTECNLNWENECSVANNLRSVEGNIRLYAKEGKCRFANLTEIKHLFQSKLLGKASYIILYYTVLPLKKENQLFYYLF